MSEPSVRARAAALRAERVPFVHARVVRADKPTSAKPGDEAVVFTDGTIEGFVGGSCAESTVRARGLTLLDSGEPLLLRIMPAPDPAGGPDPEGTLSVHNPCLSGGTLEIFLEPVLPAPLLLIRGDSPIAAALGDLAERAGYDVDRSDRTDLGRVTAVVVASHGREDEAAVLTAALAAGVGYVALVASRKRGEAVVGSLDVGADARTSVHTPAGLDIGARTPAEVAVSILAEIILRRRRPSGRPVDAGSADPAVAAATAQPTEATDPVCGMTVAAVEASLHLDHDGTRRYFCGTGCLRAFAADPGAQVTA